MLSHTQRLRKLRPNGRLDQLVTSRALFERLKPADIGMEIPGNRPVKVQGRMAPKFFGVFRRQNSCWPIIGDQAKDISLFIWLVALLKGMMVVVKGIIAFRSPSLIICGASRKNLCLLPLSENSNVFLPLISGSCCPLGAATMYSTTGRRSTARISTVSRPDRYESIPDTMIDVDDIPRCKEYGLVEKGGAL